MNSDENTSEKKSRADQLAQTLPYLTPELIAEISPKFEQQTFQPGQMIIKQGEIADCFFIIISGSVEIWHEGLSGQSEHVDTRNPGEYFGETGLLTNRPRTATVLAHQEGEVVVLVMGSREFQEMMEESKATEMHVAQEMLQRLISLANAQ